MLTFTNWIYLYDADVFFQFSILIRILDLILQPESAQRFIYYNKIGFFVHKRRVCNEQWELVLTFTKLDISIWCRCFLSIFDLIRILDLISNPNQPRDSLIVIKIGYMYIGEGYILSLWISVTIHLIGYIYMMQMFLSIFDFDSDSRPHFQPESARRFIYCNKIGFFVHKRRVCNEQLELVLTFTKLDISIWCRCFLSIFDFDSDSRPHFPIWISPEIH